MGYNEELTVEFTLHLGEEGSLVCGVVIPVKEESIVEVTGFRKLGNDGL